MDPPDSIDGLGLTFQDLSHRGQRLAQFRATERQRAGQLTDEQRTAIAEAHAKAKALSDKSQATLTKLITPE